VPSEGPAAGTPANDKESQFVSCRPRRFSKTRGDGPACPVPGRLAVSGAHAWCSSTTPLQSARAGRHRQHPARSTARGDRNGLPGPVLLPRELEPTLRRLLADFAQAYVDCAMKSAPRARTSWARETHRWRGAAPIGRGAGQRALAVRMGVGRPSIVTPGFGDITLTRAAARKEGDVDDRATSRSRDRRRSLAAPIERRVRPRESFYPRIPPPCVPNWASTRASPLAASKDCDYVWHA
jgi:hypothetical protein